MSPNSLQNYRVGITERGDAGRDLSWIFTILDKDVAGAILITKSITEAFKVAILNCKKPIIIHCTCTGYGHTKVEPNVPDVETQLKNLKSIVDAGFPASNVVLRVDPIFPSPKGIERARVALKMYASMGINNRVRVSIVDEYKHVIKRYKELGWKPLYGGNFGPNDEQILMVAQLLKEFPQFNFETCAEPKLAQIGSSLGVNIKELGCVSHVDLQLMGLPVVDTTLNPQKRSGCLCVALKKELLSHKKPCCNGCRYCFWQSKCGHQEDDDMEARIVSAFMRYGYTEEDAKRIVREARGPIPSIKEEKPNQKKVYTVTIQEVMNGEYKGFWNPQ